MDRCILGSLRLSSQCIRFDIEGFDSWLDNGIFCLGGGVSSLMQAGHKLPNQPLNSVITLEVSKELFENVKGLICVAY